MSTQPSIPEREFHVICRDCNGGELTWKTADSLEDALSYIDNLEPYYRDRCEWLVFEVAIAVPPETSSSSRATSAEPKTFPVLV